MTHPRLGDPDLDTPYGRMATATDVTGARFNLGGDAP